MDSVKFGKRLREILDSRGTRYTFAAEKMGWSKQLFNAKMLGQSQWKLDEAMKAIKVLDLPQDMLL